MATKPPTSIRIPFGTSDFAGFEVVRAESMGIHPKSCPSAVDAKTRDVALEPWSEDGLESLLEKNPGVNDALRT